MAKGFPMGVKTSLLASAPIRKTISPPAPGPDWIGHRIRGPSSSASRAIFSGKRAREYIHGRKLCQWRFRSDLPILCSLSSALFVGKDP